MALMRTVGMTDGHEFTLVTSKKTEGLIRGPGGSHKVIEPQRHHLSLRQSHHYQGRLIEHFDDQDLARRCPLSIIFPSSCPIEGGVNEVWGKFMNLWLKRT